MIKIFADGADIDGIMKMNNSSGIDGFTTNPALLRKAGVVDYEQFAKRVLSVVTDKPVSFEVIADDLQDMYNQAIKISNWGDNVYVKIPVVNTKNKDCIPLIQKLASVEVKLNITAIMTYMQSARAMEAIGSGVGIISVFAGRIADTWVDPIPLMQKIVKHRNDSGYLGQEILWASVRESFNIKQAEDSGCDIVTVPHDILKKMSMVGMDLNELSRQTVEMFFTDAKSSGYTL